MSYRYKLAEGRALPTIGAKPRIFQMIRNKDGKNISGTGKVIDGVVFSDGTVVIQWQGDKQSLGIYKDMNHFLSIHTKPQYEGENEFLWHDGYKPADDVREVCDTVSDYVIRNRTMKQSEKGGIIALVKGIRRKYEEIEEDKK